MLMSGELLVAILLPHGANMEKRDFTGGAGARPRPIISFELLLLNFLS